MKKVLSLLVALFLLASCIALAEEEARVEIVLDGAAASYDSPNVKLNGKVLEITGKGRYVLGGATEELQIKVNAVTGAQTVLVLNGVSLSCPFGPAIYVEGDGVSLMAAEGTENVICDPENRSNENSPSEAALFASDSLRLCGSGKLSVTSVLGHGIQCKDVLTVEELVLNVHSANDGLRGNDGVEILSGTVTIVAQGDGIQTSNDKDGEAGDILLSGGIVTIFAEKDALQSVSSVHYEGGSVTTRNGEGVTEGM